MSTIIGEPFSLNTRTSEYTAIVRGDSYNLMADAMIGSLTILREQIKNVARQLEWAWKGQMDESERLKLIGRYELFQHSIDVHIKSSATILDIMKRNRLERSGNDTRISAIINAASN
jgi:hypothetical protein